jgi:hypothetical protein
MPGPPHHGKKCPGRRVQVRAGVLVAFLPVQPLPVGELDAGPLEGQVLTTRNGQRLEEIVLSVVLVGQQRPAERPHLEQAGGKGAVDVVEGRLH